MSEANLDRAPCSTVLYFGCIDQPGHYLWRSPHDSVSYFQTAKAQPWGNSIDGGIFRECPMRGTAGHVHHAQKDGWTAVYFADYSVDRRPGSHSTFIVHALVSAEELIAAAQKQWPKVFGRRGFPKLSNSKINEPSSANG